MLVVEHFPEVLHRLRGPLSDDELEDGAAKAHVAGPELKADPSDLIFHSVRAEAVKQRGLGLREIACLKPIESIFFVHLLRRHTCAAAVFRG